MAHSAQRKHPQGVQGGHRSGRGDLSGQKVSSQGRGNLEVNQLGRSQWLAAKQAASLGAIRPIIGERNEQSARVNDDHGQREWPRPLR